MGKPRTVTYDVHPSVAVLAAWVRGLKKTTGRSLDQWVSTVKESGPAELKARREWLKKEHGLTSDGASWIAARAAGDAFEADPTEYLNHADHYVEAMYAGSKSGLLPLHNAIIARARWLLKDVLVCPCKTIVPFYRNHVIAQIKPSTRTRIDLGFALKGQKTPAYLIDTGGAAKGDRITHKLEVTSLDDIDERVDTWFKRAYALDA